MSLTPQESQRLQQLHAKFGGAAQAVPSALTPQEQERFQQLHAKYGNQRVAPNRLESAAASVVPGGQLYQTSKNPDAGALDYLGAGSGDLLNAGLYALSGGTSGALKQAALNAGGGALAPELSKLSELGSEKGGQIAKKVVPGAMAAFGGPLGALAGLGLSAIPENTSSMPLQIAKNLPEVVGQIVGSALPQGLLALLGQGMKRVGKPSMKPVPRAQEGQALMNVVKENFNIPERAVIPEAINKGNLKAGLKSIRSELGKPIRDVKTKISAQALPDTMGKEIQDALMKSGAKVVNGEILPKLSQNKQAAQLVADTLEASKGVTDFESAQNLRDQLKTALSDSYKPNATVNLSGPILETALKNLDSVLAKYTPKNLKGELARANQPFGQFASAQDLIKNSFTGGKVNPKRFIENWNSLSDAEKVSKFKPAQIEAFDALVKQKDPSAIQNALLKLASVSNAGGMNRLGAIFGAAADTKPKFQQMTAANPVARAIPGLAPSGLQAAGATSQGMTMDQARRLALQLRGRQ